MDFQKLAEKCVLFLMFFGVDASFVISVPKDEEKQLHAVVVLFRHGDRSPCCKNTWPTDPYYWNMSLWPDGHGQLTNIGKKHHFELGKWFRSRYKDFLSDTYNPSDIYVRSTDVDRTLMSALSNLAGLYSPVKNQIWDEDIKWQPIPVHTVPQNQDGILAFGDSCPKFDTLRNEILTSEKVRGILNEHKEILDKISEETGFKNVTLSGISAIFSSILIYRQFQLDVPSWTYALWNTIQKLAAISFQLNTFTRELARLRTGRFFHYLIDHFYSVKSQVINNYSNDDHPKFLMLSAHDDTLSDITNAIGTFQGSVPEFASTVIWELKSQDGKFFVNMHFKNSTHFVDIQVYDCDIDCPLNQLRNLLSNVTLDQERWMLECGNKEKVLIESIKLKV